MEAMILESYIAAVAAVAKAEAVIGNSDTGNTEGMVTEEGMYVDPGMQTVKDPLLSSWPFVIGISVAVLLVSFALGVFLARRKIKKGIELYED